MNNFLNIFVPILSIAAYGFTGSLHCLGMCSPMVASCQKKTWQYFISRALSYTSIGILSGIFGLFVFRNFLDLSAKKLAIFIAIISVIQIIILIKKNRFEKGIISSKIMNNMIRYSPISQSATLGLVTALLPCGFLYGAILMCASFANPILSGLGMLTFAIVTSPILIGSKGIFNFLSKRNANLTKYISIILLLIVAGLALLRGGVFHELFSSNTEKINQDVNKIECH